MNDLIVKQFAERINEEHEKASGAIRDALDHAIKCGELLIQAKATLKHGDWFKWITDNCHFSDRTARLYMRLAWNRLELEKTATIADLTMTAAAGLLTEPKPVSDSAKLPVDEPRDEVVTIHLRKSTSKNLQGKAQYRGMKLEEFIQQDIDPDPEPPVVRDPYSQTWLYWGLEAQGIPLDRGLICREGFPELPFVRNPTAEEEAELNAHTNPDLNKKIRDYKKLVDDINADIQAEAERKAAGQDHRETWHAARLLERLAAGMGGSVTESYEPFTIDKIKALQAATSMTEAALALGGVEVNPAPKDSNHND